MISKSHYEHLKALDEAELTDQDKKDIKEYEDEVIQNNIDNPIVPGASSVPNNQDNFETMVKKRNEQAQEAKEILAPVPQEDEEEDKKSFSITKIVAIGLLTVSAIGIVLNLKKAQAPHNLAETGEKK